MQTTLAGKPLPDEQVALMFANGTRMADSEPVQAQERKRLVEVTA